VSRKTAHVESPQADLPAALIGAGYLDLLQRHLRRLRKADRHPNRLLHYDDLFAAYLLAFFNPTLRSLRTIEDFSTTPQMQEHLSIDRLCRSTLSDANAVMDANLLLPLIADLRARMPALGKADAKLEQLLKDVIIVDGSFFRVASDVAWALRRRASGSATRHEHFVRLDLQLCCARGVPEEVAISGRGDSEVAVATSKVHGGVIYVADRGIFSFAYIQRILNAGSDLLLRIKTSQKFTPHQQLTLSNEDKAAGVISDRTGVLAGDRYRPAPTATLREVIILDPLTARPVRILTSLLDVPAHVIGAIYRQRWQIELFFRWLKVHARFRHLISHSANGLHLGFYVTVIAVLLIYLHSGRKPSLYAYNMLCAVAMGWASVADILPILERREKERQRDRERQARRRAEKTAR
jgi:transposase